MAKLLIVDNQAIVAENLRRYLKDEGHRVDVETNFVKETKKIVSGVYDIIICDTKLGGGLFGYNLLDVVREGGQQVAFIGTSSDRNYRDEWESRGAKFVEKDDPIKQYLKAVEEILS